MGVKQHHRSYSSPSYKTLQSRSNCLINPCIVAMAVNRLCSDSIPEQVRSNRGGVGLLLIETETLMEGVTENFTDFRTCYQYLRHDLLCECLHNSFKFLYTSSFWNTLHLCSCIMLFVNRFILRISSSNFVYLGQHHINRLIF